ncbi:hypothetical protein [Derxia lacustris]|uniref:hypothetical protein n=1 Tax=Derxia lacustris TaxID=764842 RepID=UPI00111C775A|nr:hypothetical protein [Derxia lacustris]
MNTKFSWQAQLPKSIKAQAEDNIRKDIPHLHLKACHSEPVIVTLGSSDLLLNSIGGSIKCSCGKLLSTIIGASDGSKLTYTNVSL